MFKSLLWLCAVCILTSCGVTYKPVNFSQLPFQNSAQLKDSVTVSYLYDIQRLSRNKRYAKKEKKKSYAAIGVRIKNESNAPIRITEETLQVSMNGANKAYITKEAYISEVRQHPGVHLLHALWGPWTYTRIEYSFHVEHDFKYIPIGAGIGVLNAIIAGDGNKKHRLSMEKNTIFGKTVEPGKTLDGIILLFRVTTYEPLTFVLKE